MMTDIFKNLILPSDAEIKRETKGIKQATKLKGRKRPDQSLKMSGAGNPMSGKASPNKNKAMPQISEKVKGKKKPEGFGEKISQRRKELGLGNTMGGKKRPEHSERMKENNPGIAKTQVAWKCEHCGKEGVGLSNYSRWHGDNCKHNLFNDLVLPSDDEIKHETHRSKLAIAKKGKKGHACPEHQKQIIAKKNSVSRMSDFQRAQLAKSNKENPRHTIPHTKEAKLKMSQTLMSKPDLVCPHCGTTSKSGVIYRWHFDNCKHK
jgi:transposase-like protein